MLSRPSLLLRRATSPHTSLDDVEIDGSGGVVGVVSGGLPPLYDEVPAAPRASDVDIGGGLPTVDHDGSGGGGASGDGRPPSVAPPPFGRRSHSWGAIARAALGELVGVAVFVLFTNSAAIVATVARPDSSLLDVTLISGLGLALAILIAGPRSGAHLNPALSFAVCLFRKNGLPLWELPIFIVSQLLGGMLGAGLALALYRSPIRLFEAVNGIVRGEAGSSVTATAFYCTFPASSVRTAVLSASAVEAAGGATTVAWPDATVSTGTAFLSEALGTCILTLIVSAVLDARAVVHINHETAVRAIAIGLTLFVLEVVLAPLSSACVNPARDLGPRLVAAAAGWGRIAFPGERGGWWVFLVAPFVGAPVGVLLYDWVLSGAMEEAAVAEQKNK